MATYRIRNHATDETEILSRDVRHTHSEWVHEQMGTETESELQDALSQYRAADMRGKGPDASGVELVEG